MEYVKLGRTGLEVSEISLGGLQINLKPGFKGAEEGDEPLAIRAVQTAVVECGVNLIDTAKGYYSSQEVIARALADIPEGGDVKIATKIGSSLDREKVVADVEECLKKLGRDSVDIMQIHSGVNAEKRDATLAVLKELRSKGLLRFIGVTMAYGGNVKEQALKCINSGEYDVLQIHVNALHPYFGYEVLPAASEAGVGTLAMNPQCKGYLAKGCPDRDMYDLSFLADTGVRNIHEAALKWCISHPCIDVAIPGSKRPAHIRENCAVSDGRKMSEKQRHRLEDMLHGTIDTTDDWAWEPPDGPVKTRKSGNEPI